MTWSQLHPSKTLRRQLIVTIAAVHMILMISFVTDVVERQQGFLLERARARALHQAKMLAAGSVAQLVTKDLAGVQDVLDALAGDDSIRSALITDETGRVMGHTDPRNFGLQVNDARFTRVLKGPAEAAVVFEERSFLQTAAPITMDSRVLGWAWITGDLTADRAQLHTVRVKGAIYIVVAVLAGTFFAVVLGSAITRQLRLLLAGTHRLSEDKLDQPVPVLADNDVGHVAESFNEAMRKLAQERANLVRARTELEVEVRERRRAEAELRSANQAILSANDGLRQFAYAASHDLQEPLRTVSAYSELLIQRYPDKLDADGKDFIGFIHSGTVRMQNLLKALLEYSRAGATGGEPPREVEAGAALGSALENLRTAIESSGAVVKAADLPRVRSHEVAVVQLFQNLISNAIKYAGTDTPIIQIWAEPDENYWRFAVKDNGVGIGPRDHQRIFGVFKRAHGDGYPGTGIGLAICARLVERYGGRIWVESEPGHGAAFWFTLPRVPETATKSA